MNRINKEQSESFDDGNPSIYSETDTISVDSILDSSTEYSTSNDSFDQLDEISLNNLNDYVLLEVFNHLPLNDILLSIKLVNKRFYFLTESYFSKIDQVMVYINKDFKSYESCLEHPQTELNSITCVDNLNQFLNNFLVKLPRLKVLSLCFLKITEQDLISLTNLACVGNTLKHLEINHCKFEKFYMTSKTTYERFFEKLGGILEHFIFYNNSSFMIPLNYLFRAINKYCTNLTTLVLDLKQYERFPNTNEILENCTQLKHLNLHGFNYFINGILDLFIFRTVLNKRIEHLNLRCLKMDPTYLNYIITNCKNLKVLKFSYDFKEDNLFGRKLIMTDCDFDFAIFNDSLNKLRQEGRQIGQYTLASKIASLRHLEELHLQETLSANININPLILYLYHFFKKNSLKKLTISNYDFHLLNLKAFCYVSKNLELLSINELNTCCYKTHHFQMNRNNFRTLRESFIETISYLHKLKSLTLNQCILTYEILESILFKFDSKMVCFSFLKCKKLKDIEKSEPACVEQLEENRAKKLKANCIRRSKDDCTEELEAKFIEPFILYANLNFEQKITVKLDEDLVRKIEDERGLPLSSFCPPNLEILPL